METSPRPRNILFSLIRKDCYLFWRSLRSWRNRPSLSIEAKQLRKEGITRLPAFIDSDTSEELTHSLYDLTNSYPYSQNQGLEKVPDINQVLPRIKSIPEEGLKTLLQQAAGERVERFQNCARFREPGGNSSPFCRGRLAPVVFTAYLLVEDIEEDQAPVALIPGTHRFSIRLYLRLLKAMIFSKESSSVWEERSPSQTVQVSGKKGDLIIINQNTCHASLPHGETHKVCHLEFEYMVISRLKYLHQAAKESRVRISESSFARQPELQTS